MFPKHRPAPHTQGPEDRASEDRSRKMPHFLVFFVPGDLDLLTFDPKFELGRDFCTMHLIAKFHYPMFDCSEVIVN